MEFDPISHWAFFGVNWLSSYSSNVTLKDIDFFAKQQAVVFKKDLRPAVRTGRKWCVPRWPCWVFWVEHFCWEEVSPADTPCTGRRESKRNQRLWGKWRTLVELVAPPTSHLDKRRSTVSFIKIKKTSAFLILHVVFRPAAAHHRVSLCLCVWHRLEDCKPESQQSIFFNTFERLLCATFFFLPSRPLPSQEAAAERPVTWSDGVN